VAKPAPELRGLQLLSSSSSLIPSSSSTSGLGGSGGTSGVQPPPPPHQWLRRCSPPVPPLCVGYRGTLFVPAAAVPSLRPTAAAPPPCRRLQLPPWLAAMAPPPHRQPQLLPLVEDQSDGMFAVLRRVAIDASVVRGLGRFQVWLSWVANAVCHGLPTLRLPVVTSITWLSPWLQWSAVWFGFGGLGESLV
jgi:hypothetical protein